MLHEHFNCCEAVVVSVHVMYVVVSVSEYFISMLQNFHVLLNM